MAKVTTFKDLQVAEEAAQRSALQSPKDWREGLLGYLQAEESRLRLELGHVGAYDQDEISRRILALREIRKVISDAKIDLPAHSVALSDFTRTEDRDLELARALTPPGWRETLRRLLETVGATALDEGLAAGPTEARRIAYALVREIVACVAYLDQVETRGTLAAAAARRHAFAMAGNQ